MAIIPVGRLQVATPETMALSVRGNTVATEAVDERVELVAVDIISNSPTIIAAAEAAVEDALTSKLSLSKCVHLESGKWIWDGPNGLLATHYVLVDDTGALVVRATPFPIPSASAPELTW